MAAGGGTASTGRGTSFANTDCRGRHDPRASRIIPRMTEPELDLAALRKARSLLLILLASCRETQLALEAAANALDTNLTAELGTMIERSEAELTALNEKIAAAS